MSDSKRFDSTDDYRGVFPALVTAYDAQGQVNPEGQRQVTRWLLERGCRGFFVCGGTGEGLLLDEQERRQVLEAVMEEAGGEATIIAHVGSVSPLETYRLAEHAAELGADAIAAIPGAYFTPEPEELLAHYTALAQIAQRPTMLYHIPIRTGVSLTLEMIDRLAQIPYVAGLKYTDYNLYMLQQMRVDQGEDFIILSGTDEVMIPARLMGATGAIGTWYNLMPELFVAAYDALGAGDVPTAIEYQRRGNAVIRKAADAGGLGMLKPALQALGLEVGDARQPIHRPSAAEVEQFVQHFEAHGHPG
ncbi:MAG: hypothetical protein GX358_11985 [candidate division WS1 bacterium]|nr:hypothetical protein [candidate division WS1 bacterium]